MNLLDLIRWPFGKRALPGKPQQRPSRFAALAESMRQRADLLESSAGTVSGSDWTNAWMDIFQRFQGGGGNAFFTTYGGRKWGKNFPIFQSESELQILRSPSRVLCTTNPYAMGLVNGLTSYVIDRGMTYKPCLKDEKDTSHAPLVKAIDAICEAFRECNHWHGGAMPGVEQEAFGRSLEDGESIMCHWYDPHSNIPGMITIRFPEPEQMTQPPGEDFLSWGFGVHTPRDDAQHVQGYYIYWGTDRNDGETYAPHQITHIRRNAKRAVKRGVPDFCFNTFEDLDTASRLLRNMGSGATIQAAIAGVREHTDASQQDITNVQDALAEYQRQDPRTGGSQNYERFDAGMILDWNDASKWVAGPSAQNENAHTNILAACLRGAACRWNAPEWLATASGADMGAYTSSLVAESPFVRYIRQQQSNYGVCFVRSHWLAVECYVKANGGALEVPRQGKDGSYSTERYTYQQIRKLIEIKAEPPSVETRDKAAEAAAGLKEIAAKTLSPQTYMQQMGRDYDQEMANIAEHERKYPPPAGPAAGPPDGKPPEPQPAPVQESAALRESAGPHKFSSTQFDLPADVADQVRQQAAAIPDSDLAADGREDSPHVTIKYGLHSGDPEAVRKAVAGVGPVTVRLGKVSLFPAKEPTAQRGGADFDVVKIDVEGDGLRALNKTIADACPCTDTHPKYTPHVTLAYAKPGAGAKYVGGHPLEGREVTLSQLVFSPAEGEPTVIPLDGLPLRESTDASGHEHKGKGEGGGQFVKGSGGSGDTVTKAPPKKIGQLSDYDDARPRAEWDELTKILKPPYKVPLGDQFDKVLDGFLKNPGDATTEYRAKGAARDAMDKRIKALLKTAVDEYGYDAKDLPGFRDLRDMDTGKASRAIAAAADGLKAGKPPEEVQRTLKTAMDNARADFIVFYKGLADDLKARSAADVYDHVTDKAAGEPFLPDDVPREQAPDDSHVPPEMRGITTSWDRENNRAITCDGSGQELTEAEKDAVADYTDLGYRKLNESLRVGKSPRGPVGETHKALQGMFARLKPSEKPVTVWRGLRLSQGETAVLLKHLKESHAAGQPVQFAGYSSTTFSPHIATAYGSGGKEKGRSRRKPGGSGNDVVFEIAARKGLNLGSLTADDPSGQHSEEELLLDHNSQFKVAAIREVPFKHPETGKIVKKVVVQMTQEVGP